MNELYHHGILGQKWGIRRYQNEDGSLTPDGEKRYAKAALRSRTVRRELKRGNDVVISTKTGQSIVLSGKNRKTESSAANSNSAKSHNISEKSSKTINNTSERTPAEKCQKTITKGKAVLNGVLRQTGLMAATGAGSFAASKLGYDTVAMYMSTPVLALGTLTNIGYTAAKTIKAPTKKLAN